VCTGELDNPERPGVVAPVVCSYKYSGDILRGEGCLGGLLLGDIFSLEKINSDLGRTERTAFKHCPKFVTVFYIFVKVFVWFPPVTREVVNAY
jgi:hypothetical protein